jgi:hypothetical protein
MRGPLSLLRPRVLIACAGAVLVLGGAAVGLAASSAPTSAPPAVVTQFGYIRSLALKGGTYELKLHPAFFLTGSTADAAAVAAGVIKPGQHVDDDYYIVNLPAKMMLTYQVPPGARVIVISNLSRPVKISVRQLDQVLKGTSPLKSKLIDPGPKFFLGYWLSIRNDRVFSLEQQFQP